MFSGYYGNPPAYPGAMTAFLSDDTVAAGSFAGEEYAPAPSEQEDAVEVLVPKGSEQEEQVVEVTEPAVELTTLEDLEVTTAKPKRLPKKKRPSTTPATVDEEEDEEEDEEDDAPWPFGRRNVPAYNTFFPIVFGGYPVGGRSKKGNEENSYPGGATAIANSFSTGKGGVASSHATAFGDPSLASLFRNGNVNFKKRNQAKDE